MWTSGDALVAAGHRLLGTPQNGVVHAIAYAAVAALMVTVALYGHATIVAMQKVVVPVVGTLMVVGVFAFSGGFHPGSSTGELTMLGGFWQTWMLCAVLFAAAPLSPTARRSATTPGASPAATFSDRQITGAWAQACSSACCCRACSAPSPQ